YEAGYGPCLDAGRSNQILHIDDAATDTRWPRYLERARTNSIGSSLSVPLPVEHYLVGAVNIYSRTPHAFDAASISLAQSLALHVTAALSAAETGHLHQRNAESLQRALVSRGIIDQAL